MPNPNEAPDDVQALDPLDQIEAIINNGAPEPQVDENSGLDEETARDIGVSQSGE